MHIFLEHKKYKVKRNLCFWSAKNKLHRKLHTILSLPEACGIKPICLRQPWQLMFDEIFPLWWIQVLLQELIFRSKWYLEQESSRGSWRLEKNGSKSCSGRRNPIKIWQKQINSQPVSWPHNPRRLSWASLWASVRTPAWTLHWLLVLVDRGAAPSRRGKWTFGRDLFSNSKGSNPKTKSSCRSMPWHGNIEREGGQSNNICEVWCFHFLIQLGFRPRKAAQNSGQQTYGGQEDNSNEHQRIHDGCSAWKAWPPWTAHHRIILRVCPAQMVICCDMLSKNAKNILQSFNFYTLNPGLDDFSDMADAWQMCWILATCNQVAVAPESSPVGCPSAWANCGIRLFPRRPWHHYTDYTTKLMQCWLHLRGNSCVRNLWHVRKSMPSCFL